MDIHNHRLCYALCSSHGTSKRSKAAFDKSSFQLKIVAIEMSFIILFGIVMIFSNLVSASAINYGKDGMPESLTGDEFIIVRDTALADSRVQELIDGKNYVITDCCGFVRPNATASWEPVMNIMISNETQLAIRVNLDQQKVTAIEQGPVIKVGPPSNDSAESYDTNQIYPIAAIGAAIAGVIAFITLRKRGNR